MFKRIIFIYCLCIIMLITSCNVNDNPLSEITYNNVVINHEIVALLSEIQFTDGHINMSSRPSGNYLLLNDSFYILNEGYGNIYRLNFATGYLEGLCSDPLCDHKNYLCINNYTIDSAVVYDEKIYVKGGKATEDIGEWFVGYLDIGKNKYVYLDSWDDIVGYGVNDAFQIYNDELYYLKKESESINNLWKVGLERNSKAECISVDNEKFIKGFVINDDVIYYTYVTGESVYSSDLNFKNSTVYTTNGSCNFSIYKDKFISVNYGIYDNSTIKWDEIDEYVPNKNPYNIYRNTLNTPAETDNIAMNIAGGVSLWIDHDYITALPDYPTYIDKEIINGETIYYVNTNSADILVGGINDDTLHKVDLSGYLGINYEIQEIAYIDDTVCIAYFYPAYKEFDKEGYYLIVNYDSENPLYNKLIIEE